MFAICISEAEEAPSPLSPFNIVMQLYAADGNPIGSEVLVNDPIPEADPSDQESPAVAFDDNNNLVVVWTALSLDGCTPTERHVFARRFAWDGNISNEPVAVTDVFQVDSDPESSPISGVDANPTVAFSRSEDPDLCGGFVIAFNAHRTVSPLRD